MTGSVNTVERDEHSVSAMGLDHRHHRVPKEFGSHHEIGGLALMVSAD